MEPVPIPSIGAKVLEFKETEPVKDSRYVVIMKFPKKKSVTPIVQSFDILCENSITFDNGVLEGTHNGIFVSVGQESTKMVVGVWIYIQTPNCPNPPDCIFSIKAVYGKFSDEEGKAVNIMVDGVTKPMDATFSPTALKIPANAQRFPFDFQKCIYYESHCTAWPEGACSLRILIWIMKTHRATLHERYSYSIPNKTCTMQTNGHFMSEALSDVKFKIGTVLLPAHRVILSSKSEYFHKMFSTDMIESRQDVVEIKDVDPEIFQEILRFVYTGTIENLDEVANKLWFYSDQIGMMELLEHLDEHFVRTLNDTNALDMYHISHTVGYRGKLAEKSLFVLLQNREKIATDMSDFQEIYQKHPDLIYKLVTGKD